MFGPAWSNRSFPYLASYPFSGRCRILLPTFLPHVLPSPGPPSSPFQSNHPQALPSAEISRSAFPLSVFILSKEASYQQSHITATSVSNNIDVFGGGKVLVDKQYQTVITSSTLYAAPCQPQAPSPDVLAFSINSASHMARFLFRHSPLRVILTLAPTLAQLSLALLCRLL
jgi:hypothetical protein